MSVSARFYVTQITRNAFAPGNATVVLAPVSRGPENKTWAAATPSGKVELTIGNEKAAEWFTSRLGKDIAITFEDRPMTCTKCGVEVAITGQYVQDPMVSGQVACLDCARAATTA